jgi:AcrR family transcriptional regulator
MIEPILTRRQRQRRQHEEVVEEILAIARRMMQAEGVAALNFNAIARQLGMQPPSLYTYFASKEAIYDELFRRGYLAFGQRMNERPMAAGSPVEQFRSAFLAYMEFGYENRDLFELMFQRPVPGFTPSAASMAVSLGQLAEAQRQLGAALAQAGVTLPVSLEEAGDLVIAMMYGVTAMHLANNPELPVGEGRFGRLVDHAVDLFVTAWQLDRADEQE